MCPFFLEDHGVLVVRGTLKNSAARKFCAEVVFIHNGRRTRVSWNKAILSKEEIVEKTSKEVYSLSESEECDSSCNDKKNICMECKKIYEEGKYRIEFPLPLSENPPTRKNPPDSPPPKVHSPHNFSFTTR